MQIGGMRIVKKARINGKPGIIAPSCSFIPYSLLCIIVDFLTLMNNYTLNLCMIVRENAVTYCRDIRALKNVVRISYKVVISVIHYST